MRHKELFKTYIWLIETINNYGPITLEQLGKLWLKSTVSDGVPMARSSFNRHREDIEDIFGIRFVCDRSNGWKYSIEDDGRLDGSSAQNWMINTLSVSNLIADSRCVHNRILLEYVPSEGSNLHQVVEAMKQSKKVCLKYRKYHSVDIKEYEVEPYCLKLYHRRWYLLSRYSDSKEYRVFAFDRIVEATVSNTKFRIDKKFDASTYFSECFGVVLSTREPLQRIVVRAYGTQQYYMRDLPVHPTQRYLTHGDGYTDYEITLRPSDDFMAYLLSCGQWLQVISPQSLVDRLLASLDSTRDRYKKMTVIEPFINQTDPK